jgi:hypothetical protein
VTWTDVVEHLVRCYRVSGHAEAWVELWWTFAGDVRQRQTIRAGQAMGEPCVVIAAEVAGTMSAQQALRHNATLAIGALAEEDDRRIVRALIRDADLTPSALDRALRAIAHEAARLSTAARPAFDPALFVSYCD